MAQQHLGKKTAAVAIRNAESWETPSEVIQQQSFNSASIMTFLQGSYSESLSSLLDCAWGAVSPGLTYTSTRRASRLLSPSHMAAVVSECTLGLHLPWRALGAMAPGCSVLLFDTLIYLYMLR